MTTASSRTISSGDVVFARVTYLGATILNARLDGMDSVACVLDWVARQLVGLTGLVKITLRNASRGWSSNLYRSVGHTGGIPAAASV